MSLSIIEALDDRELFAPWFTGPTWKGWRAVLKAAFALPMSSEEIALFRSIAERDPPIAPVKELWCVVGRRGGKDSVASVLAAHLAAMFEDEARLRPGERALVACLATDRDQAKIVLNYTRSYFEQVELLQGLVAHETATGFELSNSVDIAVATNSFRAVRGRPILAAILDELAFWRSENSATPDEEVYNALLPGMASLPSSMLIGISSPYRRSGLLWKRFKRHFGQNSSDVLVIKAPTRTLNPTIDQGIIDKAIAEDPAAARAEWLAEFRNDIAGYITDEAIDAVTSPRVIERPPVHGVKYIAFVDPSGGASDSMTIAIAHSEFMKETDRDVAVLDCTREIRAPFSPEAAVNEFVEILKRYRVDSVRGDRYGAEWVTEAFKKRGVQYEAAELTKSDLYRDLLPALNSGEVLLLDDARLRTQLLGLERRTARGGRDTIDHAPGARDDLANAAAGALVHASSSRFHAPQVQMFLTSRHREA
jgi:hypothetical protein